MGYDRYEVIKVKGADPEVLTSRARACQCLGCGRRLPARISAAYGSERPRAGVNAQEVPFIGRFQGGH